MVYTIWFFPAKTAYISSNMSFCIPFKYLFHNINLFFLIYVNYIHCVLTCVVSTAWLFSPIILVAKNALKSWSIHYPLLKLSHSPTSGIRFFPFSASCNYDETFHVSNYSLIYRFINQKWDLNSLTLIIISYLSLCVICYGKVHNNKQTCVLALKNSKDQTVC